MSVIDDCVNLTQQLITSANNYAASGNFDPGQAYVINTARPWTQTLATAIAQVTIMVPAAPPAQPAPQGAPTPIETARRKTG